MQIKHSRSLIHNHVPALLLRHDQPSFDLNFKVSEYIFMNMNHNVTVQFIQKLFTAVLIILVLSGTSVTFLK